MINRVNKEKCLLSPKWQVTAGLLFCTDAEIKPGSHGRTAKWGTDAFIMHLKWISKVFRWLWGGCRCSSQQERRGYVSTVQLFARCTTLITHEPACLWRMKEVFCSVRFLRSNQFRYTVALNNVEIGLCLQSGQEILAKWLSNFELKFWLQSYFGYMLPKKLGNITLHFYSTGGFFYETIFHFPLLISGQHR